MAMGGSQVKPTPPAFSLPNFNFPPVAPPTPQAHATVDTVIKQPWAENPNPRCCGILPFYMMMCGGGTDNTAFAALVAEKAAQGLVARSTVTSGQSWSGTCGLCLQQSQHDQVFFERESDQPLECLTEVMSISYTVDTGVLAGTSVTPDQDTVVAMSSRLNHLAAEGWMLRTGNRSPLTRTQI